MSARPLHPVHPLRPLRPLRPFGRTFLSTRRLLAFVAVGALAGLGLGLAAPSSDAFAADHGSSHARTRLERSLEDKTLVEDLKSGRVTQEDVLDAGEHGLTINGHHVDGWTKPSAAQQVAGQQMAAQLRADPAAAQSLRDEMGDLSDGDWPDSADAPAGSAPTGAAGITESKHWWNKVIKWFQGEHVYINGPWFKTIVAGGVAGGMIGLCLFFDFSKITCSLVGAAVATVAEWIKNTTCARNGIWLYYPYWWKSHC
ncbi:hypothetical protein ACR8AL_01710 [Clavibacter sepedonicus]|nr:MULTISPECIES: hypothetical protein [Clavibacter]MBD5382398.1 hypothetical protein [Clavibacter sp.]UUK66049.1 hypothetical protein LRE50_02055 [Clavibacter sepedonicus]